MNNNQIIKWLLEGDVSIQYQVHRDLLNINKKGLQKKISIKGWGNRFLSKRHSNGHWGDRFYQPKWISTHYTLLDLRNLCLNPDNRVAKKAIKLTLNAGKAEDGGIPLGPSTTIHSDICVNGMFLNYSSYFNTDEDKLYSIVDSILNEIMNDGGFNCRTTRTGAKHSSLHSTISVLEGLNEFLKSGSNYRKADIVQAIKSAEEFILCHQLFLSDHTGEIISQGFLTFPYPSRWKYDILRGLDYFQNAEKKWDDRMSEALGVVLLKRNKNGTWNNNAAHPGKTHFIMEKSGIPSRWNTLRALRILKHFEKIEKSNNKIKRSYKGLSLLE